VGLGDSCLQASKGKIGGTKQTEAKIIKYLEKQKTSTKDFHLRGSCWINEIVQPPLEVIYEPNEIRLVADYKKKMDQAILSCENSLKNTVLLSFLKTSRADFTSGISKVIKTFMGEKITSPRNKAWGWEIKKIDNN
jgi:hypothetical protein